MRKIIPGIGMILLLGCIFTWTAFAQSPNEKYLTGADIEKITGIKGVKLIPRLSVAGAGGDLNFVDGTGELILMVQVTDAKNFDAFQKKYSKGTVAGVGDQAVQGE